MKNIFYLLLFLAVNQTYSQNFEEFTTLEDEMRYVENLMISESGNIILWGTTNHSYGNVFVAAINMEGEIIWSSYFLKRNYGGPICMKSLVATFFYLCLMFMQNCLK